jgi:hypothetical protein
MADETYAPKPLPPEPVIHWPTRLGWTLWSYLTWPWQVRQLKAAGFRRVGWMTWETGPDDDYVLANSPLCPVELEELPPSP